MGELRSNLEPGTTAWAVRRAQWKALGLSDEDLFKPKIAVVNTSSELSICFSHLDGISPIVKQAIREAGGNAWSLPEPVLRSLFRRLFKFGLISYPPGALDYLKFPFTLTGDRFNDATGFRPLFGLAETLQSVRG